MRIQSKLRSRISYFDVSLPGIQCSMWVCRVSYSKAVPPALGPATWPPGGVSWTVRLHVHLSVWVWRRLWAAGPEGLSIGLRRYHPPQRLGPPVGPTTNSLHWYCTHTSLVNLITKHNLSIYSCCNSGDWKCRWMLKYMKWWRLCEDRASRQDTHHVPLCYRDALPRAAAPTPWRPRRLWPSLPVRLHLLLQVWARLWAARRRARFYRVHCEDVDWSETIGSTVGQSANSLHRLVLILVGTDGL